MAKDRGGDPGFHENLGRGGETKGSSDRGFGLVFAAVFAVVALWPLTGDGGVRLWSLGVAAGFALVALARPRLLAPLNRVWTRFGLLLHRVVNPLVTGLIFYGTVTPVGLIMRALGKRPIATGFDRDAESYWVRRDPPGPEPDTMTRQF